MLVESRALGGVEGWSGVACISGEKGGADDSLWLIQESSLLVVLDASFYDHSLDTNYLPCYSTILSKSIHRSFPSISCRSEAITASAPYPSHAIKVIASQHA